MFDGAVSGSGSVWYPGWKEYISEHTLKKNNCVYLSLGKREKNTKNLAMRKVEENMNLQYQLLQKDNHIEKVVIEWNEGGHFDNTLQRMEKGIIYISLSILIHAFFVFRDYSVRFNDILARLVKVLIGSLILWIIDFIVAKFIAVNIVILIIGVLLGYLAYCVALVVLQTFNQKDIQSFKGMIMFYPLGILGSIMRIR